MKTSLRRETPASNRPSVTVTGESAAAVIQIDFCSILQYFMILHRNTLNIYIAYCHNPKLNDMIHPY